MQEFSRDGAHMSEEARLEILKRVQERRPRVFEFDRSTTEGNLPSVEAFREATGLRAENIIDENTLNPSKLSEAFVREAERLKRAAGGDDAELVAEALRKADFYKFLNSDTGDKYVVSIETWTKLAESVEQARKK
ncbi:MAG: hypothetical protein JNN11_05390 [Candidatus Doudnabacteria bacterium]|nr:hypothetical protein [Candidatus Doudnabacteria bacterium]